jgi:hypothetical protein
VAQAPEHHRKGRQPEVGPGLAAARREEEQVDGAPVWIGRIGHAREVEQNEGELERPPARVVDSQAPDQRA